MTFGTCLKYVKSFFNIHVQPSSGTSGLKFGFSIHLHPYIVYVIIES